MKSDYLTEEQSCELSTVKVLPHENVMRHFAEMIYHDED